MATISSLIVKIGAQDTEISAALEKLIGNARRADADLSKLGNTPLAQQAIKDTAKLAENIKQITNAQQELAERSVRAAVGVETLGGASRLMARELDQVNKTLQTGLDAFRALGEKAPADLQRVADAVTKQRAALQGLGDSTQKASGFSNLLGQAQSALFSTLVRVAGPAALGLAAKEALNYADNLTKLSDRTGIGVVALQRLDAVAQASGNSLEDVAGAVNQFQKRITEGDQSAVSAVKKLGVSLEDLRRQGPDAQFITIAKAIQQIPDPAQQATIAMELFGKTGAQLLPTLKGDIDKLANSTVKMSAESVKALDEFGDGLVALKTSTVNEIGEIAGAFIRAGKAALDFLANAEKALRGPEKPDTPTNRLQTALTQGPQGFRAEFRNQNPGFGQPILPSTQTAFPGQVFAPSAKLTAGLSQAQTQLAAVTRELNLQRAAADALGLSLEDYQQKLDAVNQKIRQAERETGNLSTTQKIAVIRYKELGLSAEDIAVKMGLSARAVTLFEEEMAEGAAQRARQTQETGKFQQELGKLIVGFDASGKAVIGFHGVLRTDFDLPIQGAITSAAIFAKSLDNLAATQKRTRDALTNQLAGTIGLPDVKPVNKDLLDAAKATKDWRVDVDDLGRAFAQMAQVSDGALGAVVHDIANIITSFDLAIKSANSLKQAMKDQSRTGQAVAVAGGAASVIQATGSGGTLARTAGGALAGATTGAAIGSFAGPVGAAFGFGIGAAAGGIIGLYRGIQEGKLEKQINPLREAFVQAAGGLHQLNVRADEAGITLDHLLNARNPQQYQAAIDELAAAFDAMKAKIVADSSALGELIKRGQAVGATLPTALQASINKLIDLGKFTGDAVDLFKELTGNTQLDFQKMADVATKYGIDLASLGPQFQSARLHASAETIINDFDLLIRGGADVGGVLFGMSKDISKLVTDSLKFGTTIPDNMKPWILELQRAGFLVDDNGDKIVDLSGLKFADPIKTEFQKIIDKLQELIDKISGSNGLAAAINDIPDRTVHIGFDVDRTPDLGFDDENRRFAASGGLVTSTGIQRFAGGGVVLPFVSRGRGTDTVGAMLSPGELVLNAAQQRSVAAGLSGGGSQISVTFNAVLNSEDANDVNRLTQTLLKAMRQDTNLFRSALEGIADRRIAAVA